MNKFNGKARSAVKIRKVAARAQRKKSGVQEKHKKGQKLQSGLRTGAFKGLVRRWDGRERIRVRSIPYSSVLEHAQVRPSGDSRKWRRSA